MAPAWLIATDLDGTLLDARTYSPAEALPTLQATLARGIPIVPCSAKTLAEQEPLRRELGLEGFPCIVENGSAVHFPVGDGSPPAVLGLPADFVIGVSLHPFAAHSWVQWGTVLVNDQLDAVRHFTPILVL